MKDEKYTYRNYKIKLDNILTKEDMKTLEYQFVENTRLYNSLLYFGRMKFFSLIDKNHTGIKYDDIKDYKIQDWFNNEKLYIGSSFAFGKLINPIMKKNNIILNRKVAAATSIRLANNWQSFFKLKGKQLNRQIPKYIKDNNFSVLEYNNQAISNNKKKSNYIIPTGFKTGVLKPKKYLDKKIQQVKIIKRYNSYYMIVMYKELIQPKYESKSNRVASIDLGVNITTMLTFNTNKKPIGFNGKKLKSLNQWYNKYISKLKSKLPKNQKTSKKIQNLWSKRDNQLNHYLHCLTNQIIKEISKEQVSKLIIGKSENFQNKINLGRVNNQNFVNIPFGRIVDLLIYKLEGTCDVILQEESYTSKASSYSLDYIPTYKVDDNNKSHTFSGKRISRGLYKENDKEIYIHADVNGSFNIMRKYFNKSNTSNQSENLRNWLSRGNVVMPYVIDVKLA